MLFLYAITLLFKSFRSLAHSQITLKLENWMCVEAWFSQIRVTNIPRALEINLAQIRKTFSPRFHFMGHNAVMFIYNR